MTKKKEKNAPAHPKTDRGKKAAEGKKSKASAASKPELPPVDDRYLRLQADFENFRKRTLRDKEDLYRRANEDIMEELLPVLDHQELAFSSLSDEVRNDPVVQGFKMVSDQLRSALGKFGLVPIDAVGEEFDPNLHEAVSHLPSADFDENHVMVQTRRGYMLGKRLLRPAQVVVSSGTPTEEEAE